MYHLDKVQPVLCLPCTFCTKEALKVVIFSYVHLLRGIDFIPLETLAPFFLFFFSMNDDRFGNNFASVGFVYIFFG